MMEVNVGDIMVVTVEYRPRAAETSDPVVADAPLPPAGAPVLHMVVPDADDLEVEFITSGNMRPAMAKPMAVKATDSEVELVTITGNNITPVTMDIVVKQEPPEYEEEPEPMDVEEEEGAPTLDTPPPKQQLIPVDDDYPSLGTYIPPWVPLRSPEEILESIDELKERLSSMKRMMEERKAGGVGTQDLFQGQAKSLQGTTMIDGNFLSIVFAGSLALIVGVSIYAFYNLYIAVLKKFPSPHTEL